MRVEAFKNSNRACQTWVVQNLTGGVPFDVRHSGRLSHTGAKVDLKGKILRVVVVRVAVVVVAVVTVRILARQGRAGTRQEDWPSPIFLTSWPWLVALRGSREGLELVKKIGLAQFY